jgi:protein TonB
MSANFLTPKNWNNVTDHGRNNLVFQNRNHDYGAYTIRRDYNHHLFLALFISTGIFLSAFIIPKMMLNSNASSLVLIPKTDQVIVQYDITPPITKAEELPPPVIEKPKKEIATQNNLQYKAVEEKVEQTAIVNQNIVNPGTTTTIGQVGEPVIDKPIIEDGTGKVEQPLSGPLLTAEVMPSFPGGEAALFRYLQGNINYPYGARENGIKGTVIVGFVIDVTGKPVMLTILKGIRGGKDLEAEAMRVIASMPNWSIGKQNDKPVPVQFSLPVKFDLR